MRPLSIRHLGVRVAPGPPYDAPCPTWQLVAAALRKSTKGDGGEGRRATPGNGLKSAGSALSSVCLMRTRDLRVLNWPRLHSAGDSGTRREIAGEIIARR